MPRLTIFLLLMMGLAVRPADGYELTGYKWPQSALSAPITLTYSYSNLLDGRLLDSNNVPVPASLIRASVQEAMSVWAAVAPLNFVEVPDVGPPPSNAEYHVGPNDPRIRLGHLFIDGFGSFKAFGYYPYGTTLGLPGDIHFDDSDRWNPIGTLTYPDLLGAAEHELGHSLGLDHSLLNTAVMFPTFLRMQGLGTGHLTNDDIAGVRAIYGAGKGSVTPLPEPASLVLVGFAISVVLATRLRAYKRTLSRRERAG